MWTAASREGDSMKNRAELTYVGVGLIGLVLLAAAYRLCHETLSLPDAVMYALAASVLVVWVVTGVRTSRRNAREAAEREAKEQVRKEAEEAARRAVDVVNARRTTSHGGTTIAIRRRSTTEQAQGH